MKDLNLPKVKRFSKRTLAQDLISMKPDEVARELTKLYKWILNELKKLDRKKNKGDLK